MNTLTRRQSDVLRKLQEVYRETQSPVHYTDLAQRLGVNRFSAYDILKVLERKGAVGSQYALHTLAGPGRPAVSFFPLAEAARKALSRLSDGLEWGQVRQRLLSLLSPADNKDADVLGMILDGVPESRDSLAYCGSVLAALVVSLGKRVELYGRSLLAASNPSEGLDLFAGLVVGLALTGSAGRQLSQRLVEYSQHCQQCIAEMDSSTRDDLASFVREVVAVRLS
jgi:hypothetical protein